MSSKACPRCKLTLGPTTYEGADVLLCDGCWGFWVPVPSLKTILTSTDESFSDAERKQVEDQIEGLTSQGVLAGHLRTSTSSTPRRPLAGIAHRAVLTMTACRPCAEARRGGGRVDRRPAPSALPLVCQRWARRISST